MDSGGQPGEPLAASDPRQVGPYEILSRLGAGAMGRVYLGQKADGQRAAVKVVRADLADVTVFRRRFAREVNVVRKVGGDRVARVLDADADADQPWIATECVVGPSLRQRVERQGPVGTADLRSLAADIGRALAAIHAQGVVHRDLKPSNVVLADDGPKVIDFGLAQAADATSLTSAGHSRGTPAYMAPEQADGRPAGAAADVFALGSLLVFAATGRLAFGEGAPLAVLNKVLNQEPDLTGVAEGDPELRGLIEACLRKDPDARPTPARIVEVASGRASTIVVGRAGRPGAGRRIGRREIGIASGVLVALGAVLLATLRDGGSVGGALSGTRSSQQPVGQGGPVPPGGETPSAAGGTGGAVAAGAVGGISSAPGGVISGSSHPAAGGGGGVASSRFASRGSSAVATAPKSSPPRATTAPPRPITATPAPPPSNQPPAAPGFKVTQGASIGMASFTITWTPAGGVTSYDVDITATGFGTKADTVPPTPSSYDFQTSFGSRVCVRMRAHNAYGASPWGDFPCFQA